MTPFKFFGALAILSAFTAAPALAQHMIEEPGMYAILPSQRRPECWNGAGTGRFHGLGSAPWQMAQW